MGDVGKKLLKKVRAAVEDGLTLRVVTVVGDITADIRDQPAGKSDVKISGDDQPSITTVFDLVDGDVRTYVHRRFVEQEAMKPMLKFHEDREKLAHERVAQNLELLQSFYHFVKSELEDDTASPGDPPIPDAGGATPIESGDTPRTSVGADGAE